jgi:hypothetical protein
MSVNFNQNTQPHIPEDKGKDSSMMICLRAGTNKNRDSGVTDDYKFVNIDFLCHEYFSRFS